MARPDPPDDSAVLKPPVTRRPNAAERLRRAEAQSAPVDPADNRLAAESRVAPRAAGGKQSGDSPSDDRRGQAPQRRGFTLIEILVAMAVTLILLGIVVTIFGLIGDNVSNSRAAMEMTDQQRAAKHKLQLDLAGVTARMLPPLRPEDGRGYFEIIEGPVGRLPPNTKWVPDESVLPNIAPDTTIGDNDDILMFTTRTQNEPFVGRLRVPNASPPPAYLDISLQSQVAEVAWFIRGTTLYRRQLLVRPDLNRLGLVPQPGGAGVLFGGSYPNFYALCDLSVHAEGGAYDLSPSPPPYKVVANSLSDLTKREYRFAHAPINSGVSLYGFPHDMRNYGTFFSPRPYGLTGGGIATVGRLGLPTLRECMNSSFPLPGTMVVTNSQLLTVTDSTGTRAGDTASNIPADTNSNNAVEFDAWTNPNPWYEVIPSTGTLSNYNTGTISGLPVTDDVILTNVLSFDVRVWDPYAPILADGNQTIYLPIDPGYQQAALNYIQMVGTYTMVAKGAYVDLNFGSGIIAIISSTTLNPNQAALYAQFTAAPFFDSGEFRSKLFGDLYVPAVYDTGSFHYEQDGIDQDGSGIPDQGTNGIDDDLDGLVDELDELEAPPPYSTPLRGVQIKIRCFEPDSRAIREVTIVQDFVPE